MIKAISTIIVGGRVFQSGQTVKGLSAVDRNWMKKAGYITETAERRRGPDAGIADTDGKEDGRNELQGGLSG